ncbi:hypothetical protein LZ30DRAFT_773279 [Colletotrichum cereale]|nr:hypothetical protein LZ30DRAFT_773279 [Colletotrichum cereale]
MNGAGISSPDTSPSQLPTLTPDNAEASGPALPTGAVVGIAVGAVVAGAIFGGIVFWFCNKKKGGLPENRPQTDPVERHPTHTRMTYQYMEARVTSQSCLTRNLEYLNWVTRALGHDQDIGSCVLKLAPRRRA